MDNKKTLEIMIRGMDCADCANHVQDAICSVPEVKSAQVYLGAEKAIIQYENDAPSFELIQTSVKAAGYEALKDDAELDSTDSAEGLLKLGKISIFSFIAIVVFVLAVAILGEQMGYIDRLQSLIPWYLWLAGILAGGWPVFKQVFNALIKKRIISHTLMTASMLTAMIVGEWATALLIVLFMRLGDFIEKRTTEKAREAVHLLRKTAPQSAHLILGDKETDVPISALKTGDIVQVKPGEAIPVDGIVMAGAAVIDQSAISGESMPVEMKPGDSAYAATINLSGTLRIETTAAGKDSLFGRIITMVEEAEANRGEIQSLADRFSSIYLPIVATIALATFVISGNAIAAAAVMAVSCSCSFSLATPVAMLASIGNAAQKGLLFKGGKYIEQLEKIDSIFIDKTGTLTLGQPAITDMRIMNGFDRREIISLAAAVEQFSEHPLAKAVLQMAEREGAAYGSAQEFKSVIGQGVTGLVKGKLVEIRNKSGNADHYPDTEIEKKGKTILYIWIDKQLAAILAAEDILRPDAGESLQQIREMGFKEITLISGDNLDAVKAIADQLGIDYIAEMQPQEKIALVKKAQNAGQKVMMIGDGVNDAPALAQADIGIAMGGSGTDIAIETADIVLLREDWSLIPEAFETARRTMRVVKMNIAFTAFYNLIGIGLAAFGLLAPAVAAAMQSIPDIGIMANSARLFRKK